MGDMLKPTLVLTLVCLVAAALLGGAYLVTAERIDEQEKLALKENLNQVMAYHVHLSFLIIIYLVQFYRSMQIPILYLPDKTPPIDRV